MKLRAPLAYWAGVLLEVVAIIAFGITWLIADRPFIVAAGVAVLIFVTVGVLLGLLISRKKT
jgi:hypothetical protein